MKKTILLLVATAMGMGAATASDWTMVQDFEGSVTPAAYNFKYPGNPIQSTVSVVSDPAGTHGNALSIEGKEWQEVAAIEVTLPAGKSLKDYSDISCETYRYSDDSNYKKFYVGAKEGKVEIYYDKDYVDQGADETWKERIIAIPEDVAVEGNTFTLLIGIDSNESHYLIDNIRLRARAAAGSNLDVENFESATSASTYNFKYPGNATKATVAIVDDPEGVNGKCVSIEGADYQEVLQLSVALPAGKTIKNYSQVTCDLYRCSDDANYKKFYVGLAEDKTQIYYDANYVQQAPLTTWTAKSFDIPEDIAVEASTITLLIGIDTNEGHYLLDNIRLIGRAGGTDDTPVVDDTNVTVDDFEGAALGTVYPVNHGETVATVVANPSGEGQCLKMENKNYESFALLNVVLPGENTIANVVSLSYDLYIPKAGNGSNPNYKMMKVLIDGKETWRTRNSSGADDYPRLGGADVWAPQTVNFADMTNLPDMTHNAFTLGCGIHDDKEVYYLDNVKLKLDGQAGVEEIEIEAAAVEENAPVEYYDLQGRRVMEPVSGLYIRRCGTKVMKIAK